MKIKYSVIAPLLAIACMTLVFWAHDVDLTTRGKMLGFYVVLCGIASIFAILLGIDIDKLWKDK